MIESMCTAHKQAVTQVFLTDKEDTAGVTLIGNLTRRTPGPLRRLDRGAIILYES